jgi:hypothetical protein
LVINLVGWGGFVWGVVGSRNLCCNWAKFFIDYNSIPLQILVWFGSRNRDSLFFVQFLL